MKIIILAGGYGTRLQPITLRTPKSILPLGDSTPILKLLSLFDQMNSEQIIVSLNKNQEKVKKFLDLTEYRSKIKYFIEESINDTDKIGAIRALMNIVNTFGFDDYIVVGADNYFRGLNLRDIINQHNNTKADVTIAHFDLEDITKVSNFGVAVINEDKRIIEFQEKPSIERALSSSISTFFYIINREFLEKDLPAYINNELIAGRKPDNIGNLWESFCKSKLIFAYIFKGSWDDVGNPMGYINANKHNLEVIKNRISQDITLHKNTKISGKLVIEKGCNIEENVVIIGPCFIGENVKIEKGSIIGPYTTILHDSKIGRANIISGSILLENIETSNDVKINRAVIDGNTKIMQHAKIEEYSLIGFDCRINESSKILYESKIWPFIHIEKDSVINSKIFYDNDKIHF